MYRIMLKLTLIFFVFFLSKSRAQSTAPVQSICLGQTKVYSVDLADGPAGTLGSSYLWRVIEAGFAGHIANQGSNSVSVDWGATPAGVYQLGVVETNSFCPGPEIIVAVTIKNAPTVTVNDAVVCSGSNAVITAAVNPPDSGHDYVYSWTVPSGINPGNTASITAGDAGDYSVVVQDVFGCISAASKGSLKIDPLPSAVITPAGPITFCDGESVVLKTDIGIGCLYQWRKDGMDISGAAGAAFSAAQGGDYTVRVTNAEGCSRTSLPVTVVVNPLPAAVITPQMGAELEFCAGESVVLSANTGVGLTYQWINSGNAVVGTAAVYTAVQSSDYRLKVTNADGCFNVSLPITVAVHPLPDASITPAGASVFCEGDNVILNAAAKPGLLYQWNNALGSIAGANSSSYIVTQSSDYTVTVTDGNFVSNCSATTMSPVKVTKISLPVTGTISHD